jgi:protein-disulfide isomerase
VGEAERHAGRTNVAENTSGRAIIIAAVLVSISILGGSFSVRDSLNRTTEQIELATEAIEDLEIAAGPAAPSRGGRPNRPEANKVYDVGIGEAPVKGNENAVVTIVEWSDFQCPFCSRVSPTLDQIEKEYGDKVRVAFKHNPLPNHDKAPAAHAASEAAHRQGKFWEMHDMIFANQRDISDKVLEGYARTMGLDMDQYSRDIADDDIKKRIADDLRQGRELGVSGTPSFFINGKFLSGAQPFANFKRMIDDAIKKSS